MKNFYTPRSLVLLLLFLLIPALRTAAQSGNCTVLQQPCTGNGIVLVQTTGLTPPINFYCNDPFQTSATITSGSDYTFSNMEYFENINVYDNAGHILQLVTGMVRPFTVDDPQIVQGVCPNLSTATITINNGQAPDYVEWYHDTFQTFQGNYIGTGNPMSLNTGYYRARPYSAGCYAYGDSGVYIYVQSPVQVNITTTPAACTNGTATATPSGGTAPYTYLWSNGATSQTITGLVAGQYQVTVTDAIGCLRNTSLYLQQSVYIGANTVITQQPTCLQNDGKAECFGSGGIPPYSYLWNDGQVTQEATGLTGGIYTVKVTDQNGCFGNGYVNLTSTTPVSVTYTTTPSSCTSPTGTATLSITGGLSPYTVIWYTYPPQTGITATGLPAGNYSFRVTDANGCIRNGTVPIAPFSIISATIWGTNPVCPSTTGSAGVICSGASPFTYLWNTGQTTSSITNVPVGSYNVHITDVNGCSMTKYISLAAQSPVNISFFSTPASCKYASDGSLTAIPMGGTAPYSYYWSNGTTANPVVNLAPGYYYVVVTDANNCHSTKWAYVGNAATSDACYCTVEGNVWLDNNANCTADPGEAGVAHIQVKLDPFGSTFTDNNGHYSFTVPTGNYTLSEVVQYIYPLETNCPANDPVPVSVTAASGCIISHDFFNVINPLHDAHIITMNDNQPVPGFTFNQKLIISNDGTVPENDILLNYYPDYQLGGMTTSPVPLVNSGPMWYNPSSSIAKNPGESVVITNSFPIPPNMPLGTTLNTTDYIAYEPPILNWENDYTPWNNLNNTISTVVGSFDPNLKEVFPKGVGPEGTITRNDSVLDYIIHFQNLGTWYAENVTILDTIDTDLSPASIRIGASSHSFTVDYTSERILIFKFPNIHLPWKTLNEPGSNGYITYSIRQMKNLEIGTTIENSAAIFFDYNQPVITNTTLNTIGLVAGTTEYRNPDVSIYPNPASDKLFIEAGKTKITSIVIHDMMGKVIQTGTGSLIDISNLSAGIYVITIVTDNETRTSLKFVRK